MVSTGHSFSLTMRSEQHPRDCSNEHVLCRLSSQYRKQR
jgi:hypothetical protein